MSGPVFYVAPVLQTDGCLVMTLFETKRAANEASLIFEVDQLKFVMESRRGYAEVDVGDPL